jgi:hypothetical protein
MFHDNFSDTRRTADEMKCRARETVRGRGFPARIQLSPHLAVRGCVCSQQLSLRLLDYPFEDYFFFQFSVSDLQSQPNIDHDFRLCELQEDGGRC